MPPPRKEVRINMKKLLSIIVACAFIFGVAAAMAEEAKAPTAAKPEVTKVETAKPVEAPKTTEVKTTEVKKVEAAKTAAATTPTTEKTPEQTARELCSKKNLTGTQLDECIKTETAKVKK